MANLFTFPEEFDNAAWPKLRATISADAITAPDGELTADKLVEDTTLNNSHRFSRSDISFDGSSQYTFSIFAKAGERPGCQLALPATRFVGGASPLAYFNFSLGTILDSADVEDVQIVSFGDGWYRAWIVATSDSLGTGLTQCQLHNGTTHVYDGDGSSGAYFWGAYLNTGATPEDYPGVEAPSSDPSRSGFGFNLGRFGW